MPGVAMPFSPQPVFFSELPAPAQRRPQMRPFAKMLFRRLIAIVLYQRVANRLPRRRADTGAQRHALTLSALPRFRRICLQHA